MIENEILGVDTCRGKCLINLRFVMYIQELEDGMASFWLNGGTGACQLNTLNKFSEVQEAIIQMRRNSLNTLKGG